MTVSRRLGIFAEGSSPTDPLQNDFDRIWKHIAGRSAATDVEVHVVGFDKSQIIDLAATARPGQTAVLSKREPLDILIARHDARLLFDRILIAFDAKPPNHHLIPHSCRRSEVAFLLKYLAGSAHLDVRICDHARWLHERHSSAAPLAPRPIDEIGPLEVVYMTPMFEAVFLHDEATVLHALGHKSSPRDWPKFKTKDSRLDKVVLQPATEVAHKNVLRKIGGEYLQRKAAWGRHILEASAADAKLWRHAIPARCERLAL